MTSPRATNAQEHVRMVTEQAHQWGMADASNQVTPQAYEHAENWLHEIWTNSSYAISICMSFLYNGEQGVLCMASTGASCNQDNQNKEIDGMRRLTLPGWYLFEVWFFPGLVMHNFAGMMDPDTGGMLVGAAQQVFDGMWHERGRKDEWRGTYLPEPGQPYFGSLWRMLHDLGVKYWVVYTAGISYRAYCGLDCYIRTYTHGMPEPEWEAWYLLNTELPWHGRVFRRPDEWFKSRVWLSHGQREVTFNWVLNRLSTLVLRPPRSRM